MRSLRGCLGGAGAAEGRAAAIVLMSCGGGGGVFSWGEVGRVRRRVEKRRENVVRMGVLCRVEGDTAREGVVWARGSREHVSENSGRGFVRGRVSTGRQECLPHWWGKKETPAHRR